MKTLIAAFGALALSTTAVLADPYSQTGAPAPVAMERQSAVGTAGDAAAYEAYGDEGFAGSGFTPQNDTYANDWTPNMGAGTSRTSNANQG